MAWRTAKNQCAFVAKRSKAEPEKRPELCGLEIGGSSLGLAEKRAVWEKAETVKSPPRRVERAEGARPALSDQFEAISDADSLSPAPEGCGEKGLGFDGGCARCARLERDEGAERSGASDLKKFATAADFSHLVPNESIREAEPAHFKKLEGNFDSRAIFTEGKQLARLTPKERESRPELAALWRRAWMLRRSSWRALMRPCALWREKSSRAVDRPLRQGASDCADEIRFISKKGGAGDAHHGDLAKAIDEKTGKLIRLAVNPSICFLAAPRAKPKGEVLTPER